jgi:DNA-binding response OmpR family regulator
MNMEKKLKLLFIEDDTDLVYIYSKVFEKDNFVVINAYNGEDGITKAKDSLPDVILLDIMLPGMNGLDVLKELKTTSSTMSIPVILLTQLSDDTSVKEGFARQASGYLVKAFQSPSQIVQEVYKILKIS